MLTNAMQFSIHALLRADARAREHNTLIVTVAMSALAIVLSAILLIPGKIFATVYAEDIFIFVDGAYRLAHGQVPHVDFQTPLGALYFVLSYLGLVISGDYSATTPTALSVVILAVTPIAIYVLASRLHYHVALLVGIYVLLLIAVPLIPGTAPSEITMAMWYNRVCWGVLILLLLLYISPFVSSREVQVADGIIAGVLVTFLIYTKITYGLIALTFLAWWFVLNREGRVPACIAFGFVVVTGIIVEAVWHLHRGYVNDVAFTLQAVRSGPGYKGLLQPFVFGLKHIDELSIAAVSVLTMLYFKKLTFRDTLFVVFCTVAALYIISQNAGDRSLAGLVAVCAFAAERLQRAEADGQQTALKFGRLAAMAMLLIFLAEPFVFRTAALCWHFKEAQRAVANHELPAVLAGFPVADFRGFKITFAGPTAIASLVEPGVTPERAFVLLRDHSHIYSPDPLGSEEYLYTLGKGVEALGGMISANDRIFTFDQVNPFPFVVGTQPVQGDLFCYELNRTYSISTHIPTEKLFSTVTVALVPKFPLGYEDRGALWDLYGNYVRKYFAIATDTPYWTIWRRADR
jgi:hypothetical protein